MGKGYQNTKLTQQPFVNYWQTFPHLMYAKLVNKKISEKPHERAHSRFLRSTNLHLETAFCSWSPDKNIGSWMDIPCTRKRTSNLDNLLILNTASHLCNLLLHIWGFTYGLWRFARYIKLNNMVHTQSLELSLAASLNTSTAALCLPNKNLWN